jgi:hypothetical protein
MPRNSEDFNDESLLRSLREYKQRDPNFDRAIEAIVDAEAKYGKDDPAEGKVVDTRNKSPKRSI